MWVFLTRMRRPDAPYWPGRRSLSAVDALFWPLVVILAMSAAPADLGIVGRVFQALLVLWALRRITRALWRNSRYWFTTSTVVGPLAVLILSAGLIKLLG